MRSRFLPARFGVLSLAFTMCVSAAWSADYPPTTEGAKALLQEFVRPGADWMALSKPLQPTTTDYATVFEAQTAAKVQAAYDAAWKAGQIVIKPNPGQTEVLVEGVPTAEVRTWTPKAANIMPGGWAKMKGEIKEGLTIYRFKFVEPGKTTGMAYDGLIHVNGQWRVFPKAWRVLDTP